jgi:uncharacterized RDD family membrane protein YckC
MAYPAAPLPTPAFGNGRTMWQFAGFWWRALAFMVDGIVLAAMRWALRAGTGLDDLHVTFGTHEAGGISNIAYVPVQFSARYPEFGDIHLHGSSWLSLASLLLGVAYFVLLEASPWQATVGKRICRLRVTDIHGRRISVLRSLSRYLAKFLSSLIFGIGFLMAGWTRRKQALHDLLADTLVMRLQEQDSIVFAPPPPPPGSGW